MERSFDSATPSLSIGKEAGLSFLINTVLSLAFFLGFFGATVRPLAWGVPDKLALDFLPQSLAIALMSALVPALIVRKRLALTTPVRVIVLRAIGFALGGLALGALLAWLVQGAALPPIAWGAALSVKLAYGGTLGAAITAIALQRTIRIIV